MSRIHRAFLVSAWLVVNIVVTSAHVGYLVLVTTGGLIWYAAYRIRAYYREPQLTQAAVPSVARTPRPFRFNPVPG